jgi:hypothetical protein
MNFGKLPTWANKEENLKLIVMGRNKLQDTRNPTSPRGFEGRAITRQIQIRQLADQ